MTFIPCCGVSKSYMGQLSIIAKLIVIVAIIQVINWRRLVFLLVWIWLMVYHKAIVGVDAFLTALDSTSGDGQLFLIEMCWKQVIFHVQSWHVLATNFTIEHRVGVSCRCSLTWSHLYSFLERWRPNCLERLLCLHRLASSFQLYL